MDWIDWIPVVICLASAVFVFWNYGKVKRMKHELEIARGELQRIQRNRTARAGNSHIQTPETEWGNPPNDPSGLRKKPEEKKPVKILSFERFKTIRKNL